jgi:hypothetical protein
MRLNTFKTDIEIQRRKTRLARIQEKTSGKVNEIIFASVEAQKEKEAFLELLYIKENRFEPEDAPKMW